MMGSAQTAVVAILVLSIQVCDAYVLSARPHRIAIPARASIAPLRTPPTKTLWGGRLFHTSSRIHAPLYSTDDDDASSSKTAEGKQPEDMNDDTKASMETSVDEEEKKGVLEKIKAVFKPKAGEEDLTFKQRLAKMGLSALLSYGFVSNMSYSVTVSLAWFGFSKKTGLSPLAPGQWKPFLAVYAGFYIFNNIIRPIRLGVSVAVTPYFDKAVAFIQKKAKVSKSIAIGLVVFLANVCGTLSAMSLGITLASIAAGVPVFPPKA